MEHTRENCEKLANEVVDWWDMDTLIGYAVEMLTEAYLKDKASFDTDVKDFLELEE